MRRTVAVVALAAVAACGAPSLADPTEVTAPPTTVAEVIAQPECTEEELDLDATRSYAPDGVTTGPTIEAIRQRGRLIVGVSGDTLQFGALNANEGVIEGFDIDILKEVARAIFPDVERIEDQMEFRVMTYAERLPALESGEVDLVAHTMTINCNRWKRIAFSSTYYDAGQKLLVPASAEVESIDDLVVDAGRVCVPDGSTNLEEISKDDYTAPEDGGSGIEVVVRPDITDCLVALQQGDADAITGDDTVLVGLAAQDPNLEVVGERLTVEPYGVGVNGEQVDLVQLVNGVLEDVRTSGRWAEIYERWVGTTAEAEAPAPPEPVYGR